MDSTYEFTGEERRARVALALAAQPGDPLTDYMVDEHGATGALQRAVTFAEGRVDAGGQLNEWARDIMIHFDPILAREVLEVADRPGAQILTPENPEWPIRLFENQTVAPLAIWVSGSTSRLAEDLERPQVALVGTATPSWTREMTAMKLASDLSDMGYGVVTGGDSPIGAAAVEGTSPLFGGPLVVMPARSTRPWIPGRDGAGETIAHGGAAIAELAGESGDVSERRASRDRLLLSVADAVVLVEAPSGDSNIETIQEAARRGLGVGALRLQPGSSNNNGGQQLLDDQIAAPVYDATTIAGLLESEDDDIGYFSESHAAEIRPQRETR